MKYITWFIGIMLILGSCNKDNPGIDVSEWDYVVDSTFFCKMDIEGETHIINNHVQSGYGYGDFQDSCVLYTFWFSYKDTSNNSEFYIKITKSFTFEELENSGPFCNSDSSICGNGIGPLTIDEFLSIFEVGEIHYAKYDTNYHSCRDCPITDGISLKYIYSGDIWSTSKDVVYLPSDSISDLYSDSYFEITDVVIILEKNLIVEGNFNINIFGSHGTKPSHFSNGYFKAYIKKPH